MALGGFLLRTALYNGALGISHKATFSILKTIRQKLLVKLPRLPLGTVMDTSSGKLKETIVDQVDGMETTLAHLFPEMTANIVTPLLTIIYLFVQDWRLALLSLAVFPIAFVFMMTVMGGYAKDYKGAVKATTEMSGTMIEYINGIEVIKAFNQGKTSYTKLTDKVRANAQYYYDWMRRSQLGISMAYAFFPAQMLTILPFGWLFYTHGTLTVETFVTVIILALGMAAPIVAAFNFVDTLAQVGTTVSQVDEILKAEGQVHGTQRAMLKNTPVIILDEATAYIDPENEAVIQSAVAKLVKNKTVIVIAHRLSTITGADNIVVVKDGQIAAQGRHEQLVAQPGIYADFVGGKKQTVGWRL